MNEFAVVMPIWYHGYCRGKCTTDHACVRRECGRLAVLHIINFYYHTAEEAVAVTDFELEGLTRFH